MLINIKNAAYEFYTSWAMQFWLKHFTLLIPHNEHITFALTMSQAGCFLRLTRHCAGEGVGVRVSLC